MCFHAHGLIWSLQQPGEVGRTGITTLVTQTGFREVKDNCWVRKLVRRRSSDCRALAFPTVLWAFCPPCLPCEASQHPDHGARSFLDAVCPWECKVLKLDHLSSYPSFPTYKLWDSWSVRELFRASVSLSVNVRGLLLRKRWDNISKPCRTVPGAY